MLPGKKYTPEEVLRIAKKRIWLIIIPFALVAAGTAVVSKTLPDMFLAETTILVVPQRIPEAYVKSTVTMRIEDRMLTIKQQLYSRTLLEATIKEFNLYPDMRRAGTPMEDIVGKMRNELKTDVYKGEAFRIWYVGTNPSTVMKVVERLTSTFIDQSIRDRSVIADGTNQFLQQNADNARRRLLEQEKKLEEYNQKYSGELPTQQQANMQAVSNLQLQIRSVLTQIETAQANRQNVERDLSDNQMIMELFPPPPPPPVTTGSLEAVLGTAAQQLAAKRGELAQAQARKWTDEHPVVRAIRREIAELEKRAEAEALQQTVTPQRSSTAITPAQFAQQKKMEGMQLQVQAYTKQIADLQAEEKRLRQAADTYQSPPGHGTGSRLGPRRIDARLRDVAGTLLEPALQDGRIETRRRGRAAADRRAVQAARSGTSPGKAVRAEPPGDQPRRRGPGPRCGNPAGHAGRVARLQLPDRRRSVDAADAAGAGRRAAMQSDDDRARAKRRRLVMNVGLGSTVIGCLAVLVYTLVR